MYVCPDCFGDKGLQKRIVQIRPRFGGEHCDFHPSKKGIPVEAVSGLLDPVIRDNFGGSAEDPYSFGQKGVSFHDLVLKLTSAIDDNIVEALMSQLSEDDNYWPPDGEEPFYSEDYRYFQIANRPLFGEPARLWTDFRRSLLHGERFFNIDARDKIAAIFKDVHQQRDASRLGPVYMIAPGDPQSSFLRARITQDEPSRRVIEADLPTELGPPPERKRRAGRLNPAGVLAFYAAFDMPTCVAELRPTVGSVVVGARFQITEPICVLDMTRFAAQPKMPDLFAQHAQDRAAQWSFMRTFMGEIAQPISPGDEHLDYLPTQAVAEYLGRYYKFKFAGEERTIDAIIFGSAQHPGGKNIVILGSAAVVGQTVEGPPTHIKEDTIAFSRSRLSKSPHRDLPRVRIVPVDGSFQKNLVTGAQFDVEQHYDPEDLAVYGADHDDFG